MRTDSAGNVVSDVLGGRTFSEWLLTMGENRLPCVDNEYVECPPSMMIHNGGNNGEENNGSAKLIDHVYLRILQEVGVADHDFLSE